MVTNFEFATAARVVFGHGRITELPSLARQFGSRGLVVTGRSSARLETILSSLRNDGIEITLFSIGAEPDVHTVQTGARLAIESRCEVVVAMGGGSVLDGGKAVAALATNPGDLFDYLEVIGKAQALANSALPMVAVPTTAGTGAEVTRNAVLHSPEHRVKASLRSPHLLPRVALIDPELTFTLTPPLTATTGLDALTQVIEPFVSKRATPLTDAVCREALPRVARSLRRAYDKGEDADARSDMSLASLFGGFALANAGLGAIHGFAAPIGGIFPVAHGAVCAALLPDVMEANIRTAQEGKAVEITRRYNEVARLLTGVPTARASDGVQWTRELCRHLQAPRLSALGIDRGDFAELATKALESSSMKGNPVELTPAQLAEILERAF
jgi:alcohol dehydrogenase class IV